MECVKTNGWQQQTRPYLNPSFANQMINVIKQDGYTGGPLALKNPQTAAVLPTLKKYFPDAVFLFVNRNVEDTIQSWVNKESHVNVPRDKISEWVTHANLACKKHATHTVQSEDIIAGDTAVLEAIVGSVGLYWDREKASEFIEPSFWHGKK
jgi:hypothetical protein